MFSQVHYFFLKTYITRSASVGGEYGRKNNSVGNQVLVIIYLFGMLRNYGKCSLKKVDDPRK